MSSTGTIILVIALVVLAFITWKWLKPYVIKHDTTILFTGTVGSGKTMNSVKLVQVLIRKQVLIHYTLHNFFKVKVVNFFRKINNKRKEKYNTKISKLIEKHPQDVNKLRKKFKKLKDLNKKNKRPVVYSTAPMKYRPYFFKREKTFSHIFTQEMFTCSQQLIEYSVVFIDELPLFVDQYSWNEKLVQDNINEFITLFRHYYGGYFVTNAQSDSKIVKQIRDILSEEIYLRNCKKHLFGLFYTVEACDILLNENVVKNYSEAQIEDGTKVLWGFFPPKGTYATRCYKGRVNNMLLDPKGHEIDYKARPEDYTNGKWHDIYTNRILRMKKYVSPCDDATTKQQKQEQLEKIKQLHTYKEIKANEKEQA